MTKNVMVILGKNVVVHNDQNQEQRWFSKMQSYYTDFIEEGIPIPWDKVIGEAHICKVRKKILK